MSASGPRRIPLAIESSTRPERQPRLPQRCRIWIDGGRQITVTLRAAARLYDLTRYSVHCLSQLATRKADAPGGTRARRQEAPVGAPQQAIALLFGQPIYRNAAASGLRRVAHDKPVSLAAPSARPKTSLSL